VPWSRVTPGSRILADGREIEADKILVTTGASAWAAPIPGLTEAGYLDNASAMTLERLPESLIVIGASAVGVELAQLFARLGVSVTLLEAARCIVPAEDREVGDDLADYLRHEGSPCTWRGIAELIERMVATVSFNDDGTTRAAAAEQLLVATGRRPNTSGFGLESPASGLGEKRRDHGERVPADGQRRHLRRRRRDQRSRSFTLPPTAEALAAENASRGTSVSTTSRRYRGSRSATPPLRR
jgi:mercuric reductase